MNFIVYYLNEAGYPSYCFVMAETAKEAIKEFKVINPGCDYCQAFVKADDIRERMRFVV